MNPTVFPEVERCTRTTRSTPRRLPSSSTSSSSSTRPTRRSSRTRSSESAPHDAGQRLHPDAEPGPLPRDRHRERPRTSPSRTSRSSSTTTRRPTRRKPCWPASTTPASARFDTRSRSESRPAATPCWRTRAASTSPGSTLTTATPTALSPAASDSSRINPASDSSTVRSISSTTSDRPLRSWPAVHEARHASAGRGRVPRVAAVEHGHDVDGGCAPVRARRGGSVLRSRRPHELRLGDVAPDRPTGRRRLHGQHRGELPPARGFDQPTGARERRAAPLRHLAVTRNVLQRERRRIPNLREAERLARDSLAAKAIGQAGELHTAGRRREAAAAILLALRLAPRAGGLDGASGSSSPPSAATTSAPSARRGGSTRRLGARLGEQPRRRAPAGPGEPPTRCTSGRSSAPLDRSVG